MQLDPIELGRLSIMQSDPARYCERRVEHLELVDDYHYAVKVTQQLNVPLHRGSHETAQGARNLLMPLGWFPKDRLPDIKVKGENGTLLPLLRRKDQGRIGAILFTVRWRPIFFANLTGSREAEAQVIWDIIQTTVAQIITSSADGAFMIIYRLKRFLAERKGEVAITDDIRCFLQAILSEDEFWKSLERITNSRLLVAQMQGLPQRTYIVMAEYTERFAYTYQRYPHRTARRLLRQFLGLLGTTSIGIARDASNIGQAASLWTIFSVPEGIEPVRCFWRSTAKDRRPPEHISVDLTKAVVGKHIESGEAADPDIALLDIQISPSSAIVSTALLAALLYFISIYVYRAVPKLEVEGHTEYRTILVGLGSVFAAAPAAIAGALAYRGHTFVRYASRIPRTLLAILSASAAFLAVVVSLHGLGGLAEVLAYGLSVYSLTIFGVFVFIRLGPRWRRNERSRRRRLTSIRR